MGNEPNYNFFPKYERTAIINTITTVIFAPINRPINRPLGITDTNDCDSESNIATNSFLGNLIWNLLRLVANWKKQINFYFGNIQ